MKKILIYFKILVIVFFIYLSHPYLFVLIFKDLLNINNLQNKQNNNLIKEFNNKGFTSIQLGKKDLKYLLFYKKIINKIIFLNKFIFKDIIIDKKYFLYTNSTYIKHQLFFPSFETILKQEMSHLLESILESQYSITSFLWQRNKNFPDNYTGELYSNYWHYDFKSDPKRWCRLMIYLTEQDEQESIHLFDLETSKYAMDNQLYGRYPENELPYVIKNKKIYTSPGDVGTIKIINTANLLHRAGHLPKGKVRDVFFVILKSKYDWKEKPKFLRPPQNKIINLS